MPKPAVLISRCLLGIPCRYHGEAYRMGRRIGRPALVAWLRTTFRLIDICPEVDAGLPVPRPPTRIMDGRWICDGKDVTDDFRRGAEIALEAARCNHCHKAYLLRGSPACDRDTGMCGQLLVSHGISVIRV